MSRTVTTSDTLTVYPSGYIDKSIDGAWYSLSNVSNAYSGTGDNSYSNMQLSRAANAESWIYYTFNTSSIPANATIDSVTCTVKTYMSATVESKYWVACSGSTEKGTRDTSVQSTARTITLDVGTWTRAECDDVRIKFYSKRSTSSYTSGLVRLYGSVLTINYSTTITYYSVTGTSTASGVTLTVSDSEKESGGTVTVTLSGADITKVLVTDNDVDVTSQFVSSGSNYIYTITNISDDHNIVVKSLGPDIYYKQNGIWIKADKVFVKINGAWVGASDIKVKSNDTWQ